MTYNQQRILESTVKQVGFFKTSQMVRSMYEDSIITFAQYRALFAKLRRMQVFQLGTVSDFLFHL